MFNGTTSSLSNINSFIDSEREAKGTDADEFVNVAYNYSLISYRLLKGSRVCFKA